MTGAGQTIAVTIITFRKCNKSDWSVETARIGQAGNEHPIWWPGLSCAPDTSPILRRRTSFARGMFRPTPAAEEDLRLLLAVFRTTDRF
jgi:hypothetical protein